MNWTEFKGQRALILENDRIRCTFLPDYGSKMVEFFDKEKGYEWLFQAKENSLKTPEYAADFSKYDSSGFDEVFPSIDACIDPIFHKNVPDHGEVWSLLWKVEFANDTTISFSVESPVLPYRIIKKVTLLENGLHFDYQVENKSEVDFPFIWTPHILLNGNEFTTIEVDPNLTEVMSVEHGTEHLGEWGTIHSYPVTTSLKTGKPLDLSKLESREANNCEKFYFTRKLEKGYCAVYQSDIQQKLVYEYPSEKVPYLGIWKTQGGYRGDYNFALEPCTGVYDNLYVAHALRKVPFVKAQSSYEWSFEMKLGGLE